MDLVLSETLLMIIILFIPISILIGIFLIINNWVKKSNDLKNENNQLLREMIELLKKKQEN